MTIDEALSWSAFHFGRIVIEYLEAAILVQKLHDTAEWKLCVKTFKTQDVEMIAKALKRNWTDQHPENL